MRILIDMNFSPLWREVLRRHGHECVHWSDIGPPQAPDSVLLGYARDHGYIVLTHDLDFGELLAVSKASGPSVIQVRTQDILPEALERMLTDILRTYENALASGALVVVEKGRRRVRILPLARPF